MSDLPRKNGGTLAEHAGDLSPNKTQRLLNHAVWDQDAAMAVVRGFVAEHLGDQSLRVAALDDPGSRSRATRRRESAPVHGVRGSDRQRGEHGVLLVCRPGWARAGRRPDLGTEDQLADTDRRAELGVQLTVVFQDETSAGARHSRRHDRRSDDAALGRGRRSVWPLPGKLRTFLATTRSIRAAGRCAFTVEMSVRSALRRTPSWPAIWPSPAHRRRWQVCSVTGFERRTRLRWAWLATRVTPLSVDTYSTADRRVGLSLLHVPVGRPITLMTLVRSHACAGGGPVEEGFEFGKDHFGLDHSQVRLYTALCGHIVLTLAALAVCAVTAPKSKPTFQHRSSPRTRQSPPEESWPDRPHRRETRLFTLVTRRLQPETHHLHWVWCDDATKPRPLVPPRARLRRQIET